MDSEKEEQEVTYQASPSSFPFDGGWLPRQCFLPRAEDEVGVQSSLIRHSSAMSARRPFSASSASNFSVR